MLLQTKAQAPAQRAATDKQLQDSIALALREGFEIDSSVPYQPSEPTASYDDAMRYVKLRANLLHLESARSTGGAYIAAAGDTAAGRSLLLGNSSPLPLLI